ncbi:glycerol-3-phosphate dehydrogenase C-terminal domain-containing protein, partial [Leucobacter sp. G161]|uniref:glycerol-3-phosphate dehydrogenase C-terminal domain-containing protein n=1 Tax=Leucobacter sp. G161 TaxID=663704 RepID=UPI000A6FD54A
AAAEPALQPEVAPGAGITGAEVAFAVLAEGARSVEDVLARRSRLALDPALAAAAEPAVRAVLDRVLTG